MPRSVLVLIAALLATGALVDVLALHVHLDIRTVGSARFWLAVGAFAVAEAVVLHIETGRNAHSVSLAELALTVSLFFLPSSALLLARLVGGGVVLLAVRRQRPVKALFNASVWVVDVAAATLVFRSLGGSLQHGSQRLVLPAIAAALIAAAVDSLSVNLVISLTSREVQLRGAVRSLAACLVGGLACSTLGLVCVGALAWSPWLLAPIVLVVALIMTGFHLFGALRQQHSDVKVLYDFTDELAQSEHGEQLVDTVLRRVRELLRAEQAALVLRDGDDLLQITRLEGNAELTTMTLPVSEAPELLVSTLEQSAPVVVRGGDQRRRYREFLVQHGAADAVLAPVTSRQGLRGVLIISDRLGEVNSFSADDGLLLQTLATHAGTALANSQLVHQLNHDSSHDSLTGLRNRAYFQQRLVRVLREGTPAAVLLMDLDRFKEVNDTLGHHHGDLLLQQIAGRLGTELRRQDLLARLGGDEFAVLMIGLTEQEVVATAERLRIALARPMQLQGVAMEVTASIGIVLSKQPDVTVDAARMLQCADVAMYNAKQRGSGIQVYETGLDDYSPRRLALAGGLRNAIDQGQLSLRYQPQARLCDGVIIGAEALVRWEHPLYGEVSPDDFISIAEQTGQIRELTRNVLDLALADLAGWIAAGRPMAVSVNISVRNLLEADLVATITQLLDQHLIPSRLLTLEITESHLMADPARIHEVLTALSKLGVRLSVDDFGTGYSSLAYLKQLPVSEVKIDKSFVRDLATDSDDAAIVEAIVQLAHTLRLEVVAEGVEDSTAQRTLARLGCDLLQGYHLARPMRAADFSQWIALRDSAPRPVALRAVPAPSTPVDASPARSSIRR